MEKKPILYHETVQMPNQEIGVNCFFYDCEGSPGPGVFPLHWHEHIEIIAVVEGGLEIDIEGEKCLYEAGDIAVISPNMLHSCYYRFPNSSLYCLMSDMNLFRSRYLESAEEKYITPLLNGQSAFVTKISGDKELLGIVTESYRVCAEKPDAYHLLLKSLMFKLMYHLFSQYNSKNESKSPSKATSLSRERVNAILQYVDEHYNEKISLEDLAELVHINKYYICKIFAHCTGMTFLNYLNQVRVQKAVELLLGTNRSITSIAYETGFQDINYFSRLFKQVMGVSPSEIRRENAAIESEE